MVAFAEEVEFPEADRDKVAFCDCTGPTAVSVKLGSEVVTPGPA